jgi:glycine cleavage system H lipoate-binding protein
MKRNESESKKNDAKRKDEKGEKVIAIDQPFAYDEVVSVTGPEYVNHLCRSDMTVLPYEELKKNAPGFYLSEDQCIWMRAGIINFRLCDGEHDCHNCPFDQAMRIAMGRTSPVPREGQQEGWTARMKRAYKIRDMPCIHFKRGRVASPEVCPVKYACRHCDVHRMLQAQKQRQGVTSPTLTNVSGFQMADGYYYHFGHSWAHIEQDGWVRIGIDDFAGKIFGRASSIHLPAVGDFLVQGEVGWVVDRNGRKAAMQSPLSGTVCDLNNKTITHPEVVQQRPYESGWLLLLDPADLKLDLERLYFGREGVQWMENEKQYLLSLLGPEYERMAATGGRAVDDIFERCPGLDWDRLVGAFLNTAALR